MSTNLVRRLLNLHIGLVLFGISVALMIRADLGLASWDVLHQGIVERTGLPFGWVVNGVAVLVLLLWWPLRQRPGIGTVANVIVVGLAADATLAVTPRPDALVVRAGLLAGAILLNGVATGLYVGAGLGPGPRDGLMTGLAARGHSIRVMRTCIEVAVLGVGWLLGGSVGVGTLAYAIAIGPLVHYLIPKLTVPSARKPEVGQPCPA
ncbi:membrane protein YczE [Micromonospora sp. CPCC 206061]|uniref:membrane protein YczE n=1 Tax=Micromonospora sp. CPCC 206061 TaxID=3122410 RepID=UPI002FEF3625